MICAARVSSNKSSAYLFAIRLDTHAGRGEKFIERRYCFALLCYNRAISSGGTTVAKRKYDPLFSPGQRDKESTRFLIWILCEAKMC